MNFLLVAGASIALYGATTEAATFHGKGYSKRQSSLYNLALSGKHTRLHRTPTAEECKKLPPSFDWRDSEKTHGFKVLTPVKNQASCGSCWAFGSVETLESALAIASGGKHLIEMAPQQLVSCAPNPMDCGGNGGCEGATPEVAYGYVQIQGMTTEENYPYVSGKNGTEPKCSYNAQEEAKVSIEGYVRVPSNDACAVMDALVNVGPLAISVDASWSNYEGGVAQNYCTNLTNVDIDHVVQLVGYGTDPKEGHYWVIRNSWSETWGEGGFMRLKRYATNDEDSKLICGTDPTPADGNGCENVVNPETKQTVCGTCGVLFDVVYPIGAKLL